MQPDRFEADLRAMLRSDAEPMKATLTAVELHRRAAAHNRWGNLRVNARLLFGAMVPIVAVVALVAIVTLNPRTPPPVGTAPPSAQPVTSPSASPSATVEPSLTASPFSSGRSGSIIVARPTGTQIEIVSVDPAGAERTLGIVLLPSAEGPEWHLDDGMRPTYAFADGHLVVHVSREPDGSPSESANAWFDLRNPLEPPVILPSGAATFGPDGTLVIADLGPGGLTRLRRITDPGQPSERITNAPPAIALVQGSHGIFQVTSDNSGVFAQRLETDNTWSPWILRWDGSVVDVGGAQPDLLTGRPRASGANGELLVQFCADGENQSACGFQVEGPGGPTTVKVAGANAFQVAWTTDGTAVIAMDRQGKVIRWTPTGTSAIGTLSRSGRIDGVTTDAVYVANDGPGPTSTRLPLAGGAPVTIDGFFVGVAP